jgi:SAM-dependent methyltransferase
MKLNRTGKALQILKASFDEFDAAVNAWRTVSEEFLHLEGLRAAGSAGAKDEKTTEELLELILSGSTNQYTKSVSGYLLSLMLRERQPLRAYNLAMDAFRANNSLFAHVSDANAHFHNFTYQEVDEVHFERCPICRGGGKPHYCAMPMFMANYTPFFSPVKLWMECESCRQLYVYNFPRKLVFPRPEEEELGDELYMQPRAQMLPLIGDTLKGLLSHAKGKALLEVGPGTGEFLAAALEFGCEVEAVEISKRQSERLGALLGVDVRCADFLAYETDRRYDIVAMGDVLEHITDPLSAIQKARALLKEYGILWVSTPNFESGFSRLMKYTDPMWNEPWHITYFSYGGLKKLLEDSGFELLDYTVSKRFCGSMELTARKA